MIDPDHVDDTFFETRAVDDYGEEGTHALTELVPHLRVNREDLLVRTLAQRADRVGSLLASQVDDFNLHAVFE